MTVSTLELNPSPTNDQNREAWLLRAADEMTPWVMKAAGVEEPVPFRVSVGWPGGRAKKTVTRGQCWPSSCAEDEIAQIFISPMQADTVTTLAVLLHEMVHAYDDCESGHKGHFIRIAKALGFTPKWTSSDYRTEELTEALEALINELGEFPSAAIVTGQAADTPKTQSTRMIKAECPDTGYKVRLTRKWIEEWGAPLCPCHNEDMEVA